MQIFTWPRRRKRLCWRNFRNTRCLPGLWWKFWKFFSKKIEQGNFFSRATLVVSWNFLFHVGKLFNYLEKFNSLTFQVHLSAKALTTRSNCICLESLVMAKVKVSYSLTLNQNLWIFLKVAQESMSLESTPASLFISIGFKETQIQSCHCQTTRLDNSVLDWTAFGAAAGVSRDLRSAMALLIAWAVKTKSSVRWTGLTCCWEATRRKLKT